MLSVTSCPSKQQHIVLAKLYLRHMLCQKGKVSKVVLSYCNIEAYLFLFYIAYYFGIMIISNAI